jgi:hypothetical protein
VAYAALMTPEYPPFRLDAGASDPSGAIIEVAGAGAAATPQQRSAAWSWRRITAVVLASLATILGIAVFAAGAAGIAVDHTQRNQAGYVMSSQALYSTGSYALESRSYDAAGAGGFLARELLGTIRISTHSSGRPLFVGIAPTAAASSYLARVAHAQASDFDAQSSAFRLYAGGAPLSAPGTQRFWVASTTGAGPLSWKVRSGSWRVVVMNADGARGVAGELSIGARFPNLAGIAIGALILGLLILLAGGGGLYLALRRRR